MPAPQVAHGERAARAEESDTRSGPWLKRGSDVQARFIHGGTKFEEPKIWAVTLTSLTRWRHREHPLLRAAQEGANAIVTPHSAFFSEEAYVEMRHSACAEALRVLGGAPPWYRVN